MAKARAKKKSMSQQIVSTAATGMPAPVKAVAGTRWGSRIIIVVAAIAFATGVATIKWENGWPRLNFDRKRAAEVRETIREEAETVAHRAHEEPSHRPTIRLHK